MDCHLEAAFQIKDLTARRWKGSLTSSRKNNCSVVDQRARSGTEGSAQWIRFGIYQTPMIRSRNERRKTNRVRCLAKTVRPARPLIQPMLRSARKTIGFAYLLMIVLPTVILTGLARISKINNQQLNAWYNYNEYIEIIWIINDQFTVSLICEW